MSALREDAWGRMVEPCDGKMGDWVDARLARQQPAEHCELCGERNAIDADAYPPTGLWICTYCIEGMLDAQPDDARAEVGLVGSGGGWA